MEVDEIIRLIESGFCKEIEATMIYVGMLLSYRNAIRAGSQKQ